MQGETIDAAQQEAQATREAKGIPEMSPEQEQQIADVIKPLFQESYKIMYEDGLFDSLLSDIEGGNPPEEAVPRLLTGLLSAVIRDKNIDSMDVLFNLGIMLMSDVLHTLQEMRVAEMDESSANIIISSTVQQVMKDNPEFADKIMADPRTTEMMKGAGEAVPEEGPPMEGGVMGGVM